MEYLTNIKTQHITNSQTKTRGIFQKGLGFLFDTGDDNVLRIRWR